MNRHHRASSLKARVPYGWGLHVLQSLPAVPLHARCLRFCFLHVTQWRSQFQSEGLAAMNQACPTIIALCPTCTQATDAQNCDDSRTLRIQIGRTWQFEPWWPLCSTALLKRSWKNVNLMLGQMPQRESTRTNMSIRVEQSRLAFPAQRLNSFTSKASQPLVSQRTRRFFVAPPAKNCLDQNQPRNI